MTMGAFWQKLTGKPASGFSGDLPRLHEPERPAALYAIGDVHGHLDLLIALEGKIKSHGQTVDGEKWIVMIGDYVDRGPYSAQVIDHLMRPMPEGWRRICLRGNHEQAMRDAVFSRETFERWIAFGAIETLASYDIAPQTVHEMLGDWPALSRLLQSRIPVEHLSFIDDLPVVLSVPGYVFAHAGLRPDVALNDQADSDLMWIRNPAPARYPQQFTIVHGHTPCDEPLVEHGRINIDTGAYNSGRLTALAITGDGRHDFLEARLF